MLILVEKQIPLKQGLRLLIMVLSEMLFSYVEKQIPLKQGLRLLCSRKIMRRLVWLKNKFH